jgi:hypothetical protein
MPALHGWLSDYLAGRVPDNMKINYIAGNFSPAKTSPMRNLSRKFLRPAIYAFFLAIGSACGENPPNLIHNAGFESGSGENPDGWILSVPGHISTYQAGIDEAISRSGERSYRISRKWANPRRSVTLRTENPVPVDPLNKYLLSFWYRTEGIYEYPHAFSAQFLVRCENTQPVRYSKSVFTSDSWRQYFILLDNMPFDAESLELSFTTRINTTGSIWIDDIEFREATPGDVAFFERWRRQAAPRVAGNARGRKFEATGFFRVEKTEDRWWLVDPDGIPTWGIGIAATAGPVPGPESPVTQTGWFKNKYGTTTDEVHERLYEIFIDSLGFNSFAAWTSDRYARITQARYEAGKPYMPMTRAIILATASDDPSVFVRDRDGNVKNRGEHSVPDPFNPAWRKAAREKAESIIPLYKGEPWLLGWFVDNEMLFNELFRYIWSDYASLEFIKMLREKYGTIDELNSSWSSGFGTYTYSSFREILADKPEPAEWDDPLWIDFAGFERIMVREYIDFTYDLIRELDPDHLIISNRFNLGAIDEIYRTIDLWGRYDIVCMNIYPDNNRIGFKPGELEIMRNFYEGTGRPVIIGEWSIPAIDSELYGFGDDPHGRSLDWSWPQVLRTQEERGEAYEFCIKQLASLDFIIGAGWFITFDVDTPVRRANRGIINSEFRLYRPLAEAMRKANNDVRTQLGINQ